MKKSVLFIRRHVSINSAFRSITSKDQITIISPTLKSQSTQKSNFSPFLTQSTHFYASSRRQRSRGGQNGATAWLYGSAEEDKLVDCGVAPTITFSSFLLPDAHDLSFQSPPDTFYHSKLPTF
ncbi:cellulose synthase-like B [Striga asiatica]|uniref:Cellulose synthase-like B n=1 Tax=Striga asiatica TaxID=4170 RepID=A0A5A7Q3R6_STRAF|nr:cellulose synthase-like B [Striga asiatica]